ncbi:MAG: type II secretion system protein [Rhizobacter sp.]
MVRSRGFTLIELSIALAVLAVLVTMAVPSLKLRAQREKEVELHAALRDIRGALDAYKRAAQEGRIKLPADASGYPASLETLVEGVPDASRSDAGRLFFLRRVPRDPMLGEGVSGWGLRSYASSAESPSAGADVFDVYSLSSGVGLNGVAYREW